MNKLMEKISNKEVIIFSIIFFVLGCWFENRNIFKIKQEDDYIISEINRNIEIDGYEYELDNYINGSKNNFNIEKFVKDFLTNKSDNYEICETSNNLILKNGKYLYICSEKNDISEDFLPNDINIIELK